MYRIKPKPGYNVIIKDLSLSLKSYQTKWTYITEEKFDNSADIKSVKNLLLIEKVDSKDSETETVEIKAEVEEIKSDKVFVSEGRTYKNPDDVFVKMPDNIIDPIIEDIKNDIEPETEIEPKIIEEIQKVVDVIKNVEVEKEAELAQAVEVKAEEVIIKAKVEKEAKATATKEAKAEKEAKAKAKKNNK